MKLPKFLTKKNKLALVLHRNFLDCYLGAPEKNAKPSKLGTLTYGSENAQFGEVYNPQALAKEINSFLSAKKVGEFNAYIILSPKLVFSVKNQEALAKIPLKKTDLLELNPQNEEGERVSSTVLATNKQFFAVAKSAVEQTGGRVVGFYIHNQKTPESESLQSVLYGAGIKSLKIDFQ